MIEGLARVGTAALASLPGFAEAPSEAEGEVEGSKPSAARPRPENAATIQNLPRVSSCL